MPRIARAVAAGFPHHVVQRGNNREPVFSDEEDRGRCLSLLTKYSVIIAAAEEERFTRIKHWAGLLHVIISTMQEVLE